MYKEGSLSKVQKQVGDLEKRISGNPEAISTLEIELKQAKKQLSDVVGI